MAIFLLLWLLVCVVSLTVQMRHIVQCLDEKPILHKNLSDRVARDLVCNLNIGKEI